LIDFRLQQPSRTLPDALATWHEKIKRTPPVIDVGFRLAVTDLTRRGRLEDLATVPRRGVTSYRLFMAYEGSIMVDDETTSRPIQLTHVAGAPRYVVHVTCKDAIDPIARARAASRKAPGETCTQYLLVDEGCGEATSPRSPMAGQASRSG